MALERTEVERPPLASRLHYDFRAFPTEQDLRVRFLLGLHRVLLADTSTGLTTARRSGSADRSALLPARRSSCFTTSSIRSGRPASCSTGTCRFPIPALSVPAGVLQGFEAGQLLTIFFHFPHGHGVPLPVVYAVRRAVIVLLYPLSHRVASVKARRRDWWLS